MTDINFYSISFGFNDSADKTLGFKLEKLTELKAWLDERPAIQEGDVTVEELLGPLLEGHSGIQDRYGQTILSARLLPSQVREIEAIGFAVDPAAP